MCQVVSHKRPRSSSISAVHKVTPESRNVTSYYSESDASEYEPEAETSFESPVSSPASSYSSVSSLGSSTPDRKRHRASESVVLEDHDSTETVAGAIDGETAKRPMCAQRDEIVAAILTISSALGLTKETLHVCVDLLDRFLSLAQETDASSLETLSIACLWLAVKFIETPETIAKKSIKQILKRRRHSGNWTWHEIIHKEAEILRVLNFRLIGPTVLSLLQAKIHSEGGSLSHEQRQLALYFADLLLLKDRANEFSKELLVEAIWFIVTGHQIADVQAPLLAPVVIIFLAHRDNINPTHQVYKTWFALRCHYGPHLQAPWQLPYDAKCDCRVCEHASAQVPASTSATLTARGAIANKATASSVANCLTTG